MESWCAIFISTTSIEMYVNNLTFFFCVQNYVFCENYTSF